MPGGTAKASTRWLAALPIGLAVFGPDSGLVFANPRFFALLGLEQPTPAPSGLGDLLDTLRRTDAEGAARLEGLFAPGHAGPGSASWPRGETVIEVTLTALPDGARISTVTARTGADTTVTELTEALRAKAVAEAANQARSRFLATMGHELRTPLNAVLGFSEAMLREADNPAPARVAEFARQINESGRNLLGLINTILDVASIDSGRFELASGQVDVARLIRRAIRQADAAAQAAEITLDTDLPDGLPPIRGDERRLLQVLNHLLSNAVKFTEAGGAVTVGARQEDDRTLLIFVRDTGMGIAPEDLERVFEPFARIGAAVSPRFQGASLYVSRALVTGHDGRLTLQSRVGEGTTAEIRLPTTTAGAHA